MEVYVCDTCTEHRCALVGPFVLKPGQTACVCCGSTEIRPEV